MNKKGKSIQSVDRACRLVSLLAGHPEGLSLGKLAIGSGLPVQTTQSLLRTLQGQGWIMQAGRGQPYLLGPVLQQLARRWSEQQGLTATIREQVRQLARKTGEYVLLAKLHGTTPVPLVEERIERNLMLGSSNFGPDKLHFMATGQILLAYLEPALRQKIVAELPLPRRGPQSFTAPQPFLRHLDRVQARGFCICRNQAGDQIAALAVPVRDGDHTVKAALGLSLPEIRFTPTRQTWLLAQLQACAGKIEEEWGDK